ncbi:hypothetical protein QL285_080267 [Trifolium repens]|nr:hypothetical protein QL285_080267 [Trifolium repens]
MSSPPLLPATSRINSFNNTTVAARSKVDNQNIFYRNHRAGTLLRPLSSSPSKINFSCNSVAVVIRNR